MTRRLLAGAALAGILVATPAAAQQRPLVTEDPEVVGAGLILLEGGVDYARDVFYPASGLRGNLTARCRCSASASASAPSPSCRSMAASTTTWRSRTPASGRRRSPGSSTSPATRPHDVDDIVIATKIRLVSETPARPAFGLRFATKLPNASNESGLGLDTTDFHAQVLVGKTVQSIRFVGNFGLGILGDPTRGDNQNDVLDYGFSLARAIREGIEVVGELNGRVEHAQRHPAARHREPLDRPLWRTHSRAAPSASTPASCSASPRAIPASASPRARRGCSRGSR